MQTRTATITASLRDVLDRIDRLDKEVAAIDNPLIFFDAALALSEARRHIRAALAATEAAPPPQASPEPPVCSCGAPATLIVHCNGEHPCCEPCYQRQFEDNFEEWRGWEVEPIDTPAVQEALV